MPQPRILPPVEDLLAMQREGLTNRDIAAKVSEHAPREITPQAISQALARAGKRGPRAVRYEDMIPWKVRAVHDADEACEMLRAEARRRRGLEVRASRMRRLITWKEFLAENDAVVYYEPGRGFHYVSRESAARHPEAITVDPNKEAA